VRGGTARGGVDLVARLTKLSLATARDGYVPSSTRERNGACAAKLETHESLRHSQHIGSST
jgi:hypothetical protein